MPNRLPICLAKERLGETQASSSLASFPKIFHASSRYSGNRESRKPSSPCKNPITGMFNSSRTARPTPASKMVERMRISGCPYFLNQSITLFTSLASGPFFARKVDRVISPSCRGVVIPLLPATQRSKNSLLNQ